MSSKHRAGHGPAQRPGHGSAARRDQTRRGEAGSASARRWVLLGSGLAVALIAVVAGFALLSGGSGSTKPAASGDLQGTVVLANGGHWTNITPDTLAAMLEKKDLTLLNVKTPYMGEISGTDLWIPYTDIAARATELPVNKAARIVVYCRTGHESAIAAQTLLDLGYSNVVNLDGGMTAWTASGRQLVQVNRG